MSGVFDMSELHKGAFSEINLTNNYNFTKVSLDIVPQPATYVCISKKLKRCYLKITGQGWRLWCSWYGHGCTTFKLT